MRVRSIQLHIDINKIPSLLPSHPELCSTSWFPLLFFILLVLWFRFFLLSFLSLKNKICVRRLEPSVLVFLEQPGLGMRNKSKNVVHRASGVCFLLVWEKKQFIFRTSEPQVWLSNWCVIPFVLEFKEIICLQRPKHTFQYKNSCKHLHLPLRLIIHRQHYWIKMN